MKAKTKDGYTRFTSEVSAIQGAYCHTTKVFRIAHHGRILYEAKQDETTKIEHLEAIFRSYEEEAV